MVVQGPLLANHYMPCSWRSSCCLGEQQAKFRRCVLCCLSVTTSPSLTTTWIHLHTVCRDDEEAPRTATTGSFQGSGQGGKRPGRG